MSLKYIFFFLAVCLSPCLLAQIPDDLRWDSNCATTGVTKEQISDYYVGAGGVKTIAKNGQDIIVGGYFSGVGKNIAMWKGNENRWEEIGGGVNGAVLALDVDGDDIYVAGKFSKAGEIPVNNIARWNRTSKQWYPLGLGINGPIKAITRYKGELYAGGYFSVAGDTLCRSIARWDGKQWLPLGNGNKNGVVGLANEIYALTIYQDKLFVGGMFDAAGSDSTRARFACWDGVTWQNVPGGLVISKPTQWQASVNVMAAHDSLLIISGAFNGATVNGVTIKASNILAYNGKSWFSLTQLDTTLIAQSMAINSEEIVIANGLMQSVDGVPALRIARLPRKTMQWEALAGGVGSNIAANTISALCLIDSLVYCGGSFDVADGKFVNNIARYTARTKQWNALGNNTSLGIAKVSSRYYSIGVANTRQGLLSYGFFDYAGNEYVNGLALLSNGSWVQKKDGISNYVNARQVGSNTYIIPSVYSIAEYNNSLVFAGDFGGFNEVVSRCLIQYDSAGTFSSLDNGVSGSVGGQNNLKVKALCSVGNTLYAGGAFEFVGSSGITCNNIAKWTGTAWQALGTGVSSLNVAYEGVVSAIVADSTGALYVGGIFSKAGNSLTKGLAKWDGTTWTNIGYYNSDDIGIINTMLLHKGDLYIAGNFTQRGGKVVNGIARWDGTEWHDLDGGIVSQGSIYAMAIKGNTLYVAGDFKAIGDIPASSVAAWDFNTQQWSALGSGIEGTVNSIAFNGDTVFFCGDIKKAGMKTSAYIAAWLPNAPTSVERLNDIQPLANSLLAYPNPSTSRTTVHCSLAKSGRTTIILFDALGRDVVHVLDEELQSGEFSISLDMTTLPVGVYNCLLISDSGSSARTLIVKQ